MTTSPVESDDDNDSSYTDVQIHDSQLPEDLQPANDLDPSGTQRPSEDGAAGGADDQMGQVAEGTNTSSDGDSAASDAPASSPER